MLFGEMIFKIFTRPIYRRNFMFNNTESESDLREYNTYILLIFECILEQIKINGKVDEK